MSQFHLLTDEEIFAALSDASNVIRAVSFDRTTKYAALGLPQHSPYLELNEFRRLTDLLTSLGLRPRIYRSSGAKDIQLFMYLVRGYNSAQVQESLTKVLSWNGFPLRADRLFVYPGDGALSLPLQRGFAWLNEDLQPIVTRVEIALDAAVALFCSEMSRYSTDFDRVTDAADLLPDAEMTDAEFWGVNLRQPESAGQTQFGVDAASASNVQLMFPVSRTGSWQAEIVPTVADGVVHSADSVTAESAALLNEQSDADIENTQPEEFEVDAHNSVVVPLIPRYSAVSMEAHEVETVELFVAEETNVVQLHEVESNIEAPVELIADDSLAEPIQEILISDDSLAASIPDISDFDNSPVDLIQPVSDFDNSPVDLIQPVSDFENSPVESIQEISIPADSLVESIRELFTAPKETEVVDFSPMDMDDVNAVLDQLHAENIHDQEIRFEAVHHVDSPHAYDMPSNNWETEVVQISSWQCKYGAVDQSSVDDAAIYEPQNQVGFAGASNQEIDGLIDEDELPESVPISQQELDEWSQSGDVEFPISQTQKVETAVPTSQQQLEESSLTQEVEIEKPVRTMSNKVVDLPYFVNATQEPVAEIESEVKDEPGVANLIVVASETFDDTTRDDKANEEPDWLFDNAVSEEPEIEREVFHHDVFDCYDDVPSDEYLEREASEVPEELLEDVEEEPSIRFAKPVQPESKSESLKTFPLWLVEEEPKVQVFPIPEEQEVLEEMIVEDFDDEGEEQIAASQGQVVEDEWPRQTSQLLHLLTDRSADGQLDVFTRRNQARDPNNPNRRRRPPSDETPGTED